MTGDKVFTTNVYRTAPRHSRLARQAQHKAHEAIPTVQYLALPHDVDQHLAISHWRQKCSTLQIHDLMNQAWCDRMCAARYHSTCDCARDLQSHTPIVPCIEDGEQDRQIESTVIGFLALMTTRCHSITFMPRVTNRCIKVESYELIF